MENAVIVFTRKSLAQLLRYGGTGDWVADQKRIKKCRYVICTHHDDWESDDHSVEPGAAFVIGKVSGVTMVPSPATGGERAVIHFSEYAEVRVPNVWTGNRNPVAYGVAEDLLGISDLSTLEWKPFPHDQVEAPKPAPLTIEQAKAGLAAGLGIPPACIEITIRA